MPNDSVDPQELQKQNEYLLQREQELSNILNTLKQKAASKIKELLGANEALQSRVLELEGVTAQQQQRLEEIEEQNHGLLQSVEQFESERTRWNEDKERLGREVEEIQEQTALILIKKDQEIANLKERVVKVDETQQTIGTLEDALCKSQAKVDALKGKVQELEAELLKGGSSAEKDLVIVQLEEKVAQLVKEREGLLLQNEIVVQESRDSTMQLQESLQLAQAEIDVLNRKTKDMEVALKKDDLLKDKELVVEELERRIATLIKENKELSLHKDQESSNVQESLRLAQAEIDALNNKIQDLEVDLVNLGDKQVVNAQLEERILSLTEEKSVQDQEIVKITKELNDLRLQDTTVIAQPLVQSDLQEKIHNLESQLAECELSKRELESLIENLGVENQALETERQQFEVQLQNMEIEKQFLESELLKSNEKLESFKLAVSQKLKQEMETSEQLRLMLSQSQSETEELKIEIGNCHQKIGELQESLMKNTIPDDSRQELQYLHTKVTDLVAELQKREGELTRLREYLVEVEETTTQETLVMQSTINEYQSQIQQLEREREEWITLNQNDTELRQFEIEELNKTKVELENTRNQLNHLSKCRENDQQTIFNLQNVLAQFEADKNQELEDALFDLSKTVEKLESEIEVTKSENISLKAEIDSLLSKNTDFEGLKRQLSEKTELIGQLRHDILNLQSHLSESMRLLKKGNNDDSVDKKLISNLILGFLSLPHGDTKRFEILQIIATVLKLGDEEKQKIGLVRSGGVGAGSPTVSTNGGGKGESFLDMWITFLEKETSNEINGALKSPSSPNTVGNTATIDPSIAKVAPLPTEKKSSIFGFFS